MARNRIVIADDSLLSRRVLEDALVEGGYEVLAFADGAAAWQALQEPNAPDMAILDWVMPGMDGPQICKEVRKLARSNYIYVMLLTARSAKQDIVAGLHAGADDYLVKPFDGEELRARLNVGRRILDLQNQLFYLCDKLQTQATHDSLTGIWNHAAIIGILEQELARAKRQEKSVGLIMADLDHFKQVNDTYGHPAGDAVLCESVRCLRGVLRPYDGLGRYGGEEFLIVLPDCSPRNTSRLAERLRKQLASEPVTVDGHAIAVTASMGATVYESTDPVDPMQLLRTADTALYRAKQAGRNRVEFAPPSTVVTAPERLN